MLVLVVILADERAENTDSTTYDDQLNMCIFPACASAGQKFIDSLSPGFLLSQSKPTTKPMNDTLKTPSSSVDSSRPAMERRVFAAAVMFDVQASSTPMSFRMR